MGPMLGVKLTGFKGLAVCAGTIPRWEPLGPWEQENKHFPCVCVWGGACTKSPHTLQGPVHGEEDQGESGHLSVTGNDKKMRERKTLPRPPSGHVPPRTLTIPSATRTAPDLL